MIQDVFVSAALALVFLISLGISVSLLLKRKDIADVFWGVGFIAISWTGFIVSEHSSLSLLAAILVTLWGVRLSLHIFLRNLRKKEDFRYAKYTSWKDLVFKVFLLQGLILYIVALPILFIEACSLEFSVQRHLFFVLVWFFGFCVEFLADWQLYKFLQKKSQHEKWLTKGLWSISRHPNFAGELIQWWAIFGLSLVSYWSLTLIVSPLLLTFLIVKVSGVAPLEAKHSLDSSYNEYKQKTPVLFPSNWVNAGIFYISWYVIVALLASKMFVASCVSGVAFFAFQLMLFKKSDRKSFVIAPSLVTMGVALAIAFEKTYLYLGFITYTGSTELPLAILTLYAFFCLSLNSSMDFLNKRLWVTGLLGAGALFSYIVGQKLGAVQLMQALSIPELFVGWGLYLVCIVLINRRLNQLYQRYSYQKHLKEPFTVFFDDKCPICSREMRSLKKRVQSGNLVYATLSSEQEFIKQTKLVSYASASKSITGITQTHQVVQGTLALSEIYARTSLLPLAIFIQTPILKLFFSAGYWVWARIRPKSD